VLLKGLSLPTITVSAGVPVHVEENGIEVVYTTRSDIVVFHLNQEFKCSPVSEQNPG
jgi:hypothetical protein